MEQKYNNLITLLSEIGKELKENYKDKLKKPDKNGRNAIASGKLFNSIEYKIDYKEGNVNLYFVAEDYWINVENGRSKGSKYPPIFAIRKWILQKKINKTHNIEYKIQRRISILGIKPRPFLKQVSKNLIKNNQIKIEEALKKDLNENIDLFIKKNKIILQKINSKDINIK